MAMMMSLALPAFAADTDGVVINPNGGQTANLRQCPDFMAASIVGTIPVGTTVQILGKEGDWYQVKTGQRTGYVHANFVDHRPAAQVTTAFVAVGPISLHDAASMTGRVLAQLMSGAEVTVLGRGDVWTQVRSGNLCGYVLTANLSFGGQPLPTARPVPPVVVCPTVPPVVCPPLPPVCPPPAPVVLTPNANATVVTKYVGNLNLRAWTDDTSAILGTFAYGTRVRVLTHGADWCRVQVGSLYGYMVTKYLAFDQKGYDVKPSAPKAYAAYVNNPAASQWLNLRQEPSDTAKILGQFYNGTKVTVLGVGTLWCRVSVSGVQGYMMTKYLKLDAAATPNKTVVNNRSYVNLRAGAGYGFSVIKRVLEGDAATVVVPYPVWSKVIVKQNNGYVIGFMMNSFLK